MTPTEAGGAQPGQVLILAAGRDGELAHKVLAEARHACHLCASWKDLVDRLGDDVSALLIAEELMSEPLHASLAAALAAQPAWSDLPILVVAHDATHQSRRNALAGNLSMEQELIFIEMLNRGIARGRINDPDLRPMRVSRISMDRELNYRSKLDRRPKHLEELREFGRTKWRWFMKERETRIEQSPTKGAA